MEDSQARSLIKTLSWRITGSVATFFIAWIIGGDIVVAGTIAVIQIVANTVLYYIHERLWNKVFWGKVSN